MTNKTRTRKRKRRAKPRRKTFLIDSDTLMDLGVIQSALRATSSAEALRVSVRKMAELVRYANKGRQIQVVNPNKVVGPDGELVTTPPIVLDIPCMESSVDSLGSVGGAT